jgi:uncharacterized SAM-binding protein YcdF (DUF218 family)
MFFFLSKTVFYLVMPFTLICLCLIISFFLKNLKWKKRLRVGGIIMLLFFTNEFIANEVGRWWEIQATPFADIRHYKLAIVLTGATIDKTDPNDRVYFQRGADRVFHTVQLYKLGLIERILISGGSGSLVGASRPEADLFKDAMIVMGVPDSVIQVENKTRNTHESAVEVKKLLSKLPYQDSDCLLVTSAFHMRRSLACYRKAGLNPTAFSTDFFSHRRDFYLDTLIVPQLDALLLWHKLVKEWIGMLAYKIAGYI